MMERLLERVSLSVYRDNFIIKGGMLITSMVGISMRSTMDIDTTVMGQDLNLENAQRIVSEIADIQIGDGITPRAIEYNYKLMLEEREIE